MRIEGLIAVRYLFARRQRSVVNIISWISLIGLMVSTAALIIVLSVYNGIGELTKTLFNTFDPELIIEPAVGKTFRLTDIPYSSIVNTEGVAEVVPLASESAWITYGDQQSIATLRGVGEGYQRISGLDTLLHDGHYQLADNLIIVGGDIFHQLGMRIPSSIPATIHVPKRNTTSLGMTMDEAFNIAYAYPVANFFIQQDIDRRYVVTHIDLVRQLMHYAPDECNALALRLQPGSNAAKVKNRLKASLLPLHDSLLIKDRHDQQPLYFKIFRTERLGIYLILSLIVLISTLSLVASLSLLITSKRNDIFMLRSMGMTVRQMRRSFLSEGFLICAVAVAAGLIIGFMVCLLQQELGLIRMGDGNFVVEAFPVAMRLADFLWTFLLVMTISTLSVALTVRHAHL